MAPLVQSNSESRTLERKGTVRGNLQAQRTTLVRYCQQLKVFVNSIIGRRLRWGGSAAIGRVSPAPSWGAGGRPGHHVWVAAPPAALGQMDASPTNTGRGDYVRDRW